MIKQGTKECANAVQEMCSGKGPFETGRAFKYRVSTLEEARALRQFAFPNMSKMPTYTREDYRYDYEEEMSKKNVARVISGRMLSHTATKEINGESYEIRFRLLRLKDRNCFRVIHEEYFSKYQDAGDLYHIDKKVDVKDMQEAIKYLEEHGISISDMR